MRLERGTIEDAKMFFDCHKGRLNADLETVKDILRNWEIWKLYDPEQIAVIVVKDGSGHIAGEKVGTKRMKWVLNALGINRTTVGNEFKKGHSLAKRLGFHVEMTEKGVTHYVRCIRIYN